MTNEPKRIARWDDHDATGHHMRHNPAGGEFVAFADHVDELAAEATEHERHLERIILALRNAQAEGSARGDGVGGMFARLRAVVEDR